MKKGDIRNMRGVRKILRQMGIDGELLKAGMTAHGLEPKDDKEEPPIPRSKAEIEKVQELEDYLGNKNKKNSLPDMLNLPVVREVLADVPDAPTASAAHKLLSSARKITKDHKAALQLAESGAIAGYRLQMTALKAQTQAVMEQAQDMYAMLKECAGEGNDAADPVSQGVNFTRNLVEKLENLCTMMKEPDISPEGGAVGVRK
jgi:hypothetical protein